MALVECFIIHIGSFVGSDIVHVVQNFFLIGELPPQIILKTHYVVKILLI